MRRVRKNNYSAIVPLVLREICSYLLPAESEFLLQSLLTTSKYMNKVTREVMGDLYSKEVFEKITNLRKSSGNQFLNIFINRHRYRKENFITAKNLTLLLYRNIQINKTVKRSHIVITMPRSFAAVVRICRRIKDDLKIENCFKHVVLVVPKKREKFFSRYIKKARFTNIVLHVLSVGNDEYQKARDNMANDTLLRRSLILVADMAKENQIAALHKFDLRLEEELLHTICKNAWLHLMCMYEYFAEDSLMKSDLFYKLRSYSRNIMTVRSKPCITKDLQVISALLLWCLTNNRYREVECLLLSRYLLEKAFVSFKINLDNANARYLLNTLDESVSSFYFDRKKLDIILNIFSSQIAKIQQSVKEVEAFYTAKNQYDAYLQSVANQQQEESPDQVAILIPNQRIDTKKAFAYVSVNRGEMSGRFNYYLDGMQFFAPVTRLLSSSLNFEKTLNDHGSTLIDWEKFSQVINKELNPELSENSKTEKRLIELINILDAATLVLQGKNNTETQFTLLQSIDALEKLYGIFKFKDYTKIASKKIGLCLAFNVSILLTLISFDIYSVYNEVDAIKNEPALFYVITTALVAVLHAISLKLIVMNFNHEKSEAAEMWDEKLPRKAEREVLMTCLPKFKLLAKVGLFAQRDREGQVARLVSMPCNP